MIIHIYNLLSWLAPTRCHGMRRWLLRWAGVVVPNSVKLCHGVTIYGRQIRFGEAVWVSAQTVFSTIENVEISIGSQCAIGPCVLFATGSHEIGDHAERAGKGVSRPIQIGAGCWIGARAVILGGVTVGDGSIIAAGSVVLPGDYPSDSLLAGTPAVVKRRMPHGGG